MLSWCFLQHTISSRSQIHNVRITVLCDWVLDYGNVQCKTYTWVWQTIKFNWNVVFMIQGCVISDYVCIDELPLLTKHIVSKVKAKLSKEDKDLLLCKYLFKWQSKLWKPLPHYFSYAFSLITCCCTVKRFALKVLYQHHGCLLVTGEHYFFNILVLKLYPQ